MKNDWKRIWEKREINESLLSTTDRNALFAELKRCNGFDVVGGGIPLESLLEQYRVTKEKLTQYAPQAKSVYEVGCGSGANLFLFEQDGWKTGGLDYSEALTGIAKKVLRSEDLLCAGAADLPDAPEYDCLFANSVFSYFESTDYAEEVLEKMYRKARYAIALIDIHDAEQKDAFIAYRKAEIEDYEERYRNLPKFFYSRDFFVQFAEKHGMKIEFYQSDMEGYWNNPFVFHLVMYKL